jgi:hypothetical protein
VTAPIRNPIGANMALRRRLVDEIGGFTSALGRGGTNTMGCEETDLFIRARQSFPSSTWLFEPMARVRHRVPSERATFRYFVQRCYGEGKSKALLVGRVGTSNGLESERRYVLHVLPAGVLRGLLDPFVRRRPDGLGRAAAIAIGLAATTVGYARGRIPDLVRRQSVASAERAARYLMLAAGAELGRELAVGGSKAVAELDFLLPPELPPRSPGIETSCARARRP